MNNKEEFEHRGIIDGPGAILRRARLAKGLDIEAVAAMLHLSEFKINAIEADDFDSLPEPVFVRGYLKNYARLLDEPVGPVLDAYSRFGFETELSEQSLMESEVKVKAKVEVSSDHDLVRIISVVVIAALIIVPIALWWDDLGQAVQKLMSSEGTPQPELAIPIPLDKEAAGATESMPLPVPSDGEVTSEPEVAEEGGDRIKTTIQLEPAQEPIESVIKEIEPSGGESKSIPLPLPSATQEEVEVKPLAETVAETAPEPIKPVVSSPPPAPKPAPVPVSKGVWFNFVDSGWVKVRDAKDRVILIGEHEKGTRKKLTSMMPYKVVLGNSNAVKVEIDGKLADISKYSSGGVARFTIIDGKIDKP